MAPPTKLTPEVHARIVKFVRGGVYLETAAAAAGISKRSLYSWLSQGRKATEGIHFDFAEDVEQAIGQDEVRSVLTHEQLSAQSVSKTVQCKCGAEVTISVPVPGNVQLAALQWKMSRKYPDRYGNRLKIEHAVQTELQQLLEAIRPRLSPGAYDELVTALESEMGVEGVVEGSAEESTG